MSCDFAHAVPSGLVFRLGKFSPDLRPGLLHAVTP